MLAIHSRGFFSDLGFPSITGLVSLDFFPTAEREDSFLAEIYTFLSNVNSGLAV
jgi:hypothetical protein